MSVLRVTGSLMESLESCSIQGLELLSDIFSHHSQYEGLKMRLEIKAKPLPSLLECVSMVAARVLTILINDMTTIV